MKSLTITITMFMGFTVPSSACSISAVDGCGEFLSRTYIDMTNPGEQNPHCVP